MHNEDTEKRSSSHEQVGEVMSTKRRGPGAQQTWPPALVDIRHDSRGRDGAREREEGKRVGFDVELMEGDCNWPAVMQAVDEVGYTGGWGSAEVRGGDGTRLEFIADRMQRIFDLP